MNDPFQIVGTTIAEKYRVDRVLGEGGYGVVYAGVQLALGVDVAIKLLKPIAGAYAGEAQATQSFLKEARVLFALSHSAIVRMYDVGDLTTRLGSVPYVVLELLLGVGLDDEIARRRREGGPPFSVTELAEVFEPVLEGLAFAHERGVVHRDLKPSNVMLVPGAYGKRTAKVLDFGTARSGTQEVSMGTTGFTPRYASPEQWDPSFGTTGPASDVFSFGLILAEACTLEPSFVGTSPGQILAQAVNPNHVVAVCGRRPDLPDAFDHLLARATRRPMHERFASAGELLAALRSAVAQGANAPAPYGVPHSPGVYASPNPTQAPWSTATQPNPALATGGAHGFAAPTPASTSSPAGWIALGVAIAGVVLLVVGAAAVFLYLRSQDDAVLKATSSGSSIASSHVGDVSAATATATASATATATATSIPIPTAADASRTVMLAPSMTASAPRRLPIATNLPVSSLVLARSTVPAGEPIEVRFQPAIADAPNERHWITIVAVSDPDSTWGDWNYVNTGATTHTIVKRAPGPYEIRLHDAYPRYTTHVIARARVQVIAP